MTLLNKLNNKPISVHVTTMGCSKNLVDSEVLMGRLHSAGLQVVHERRMEKADVAIINTCGFVQDAIEENISQILEWISRKEHGRIQKLIVTGCLVKRFKEALQRELPEVDGFYTMDQAHLLVRDLTAGCSPAGQPRRMLSTPSHYAWLKIAEGCDRRCAFCTIPFIRGKNVSRPEEELVEEAQWLARQGVKELILIAQDTTRYGLDIYGKPQLPSLLKELEKVEGIEWIRLHYTYPDKVLYQVLEVMKDSKKICHYLDIPLQHISDPVLSSMRRGHTKALAADILKQFRRQIPDVAVRTTMITGYPGETEQHFQELKEFVESFGFDRLGAFVYSPEEGTAAAGFKHQVPEKVAQKRMEELMELQKNISARLNSRKEGKVLKAIAERKEGPYRVMRSQYDSPEVDTEIFVTDDGTLENGQFYHIQITRAGDYDLWGKPVQTQP